MAKEKLNFIEMDFTTARPANQPIDQETARRISDFAARHLGNTALKNIKY